MTVLSKGENAVQQYTIQIFSGPEDKELSHSQKKPFFLSHVLWYHTVGTRSSGQMSPNEQSALTDLEDTEAEDLGEGKKAERPKGENSLWSWRREGLE